jgi:methanogenic corrinoid protein MtbC1
MENQKLSKNPIFNLSKVVKETGIKADTLRAWERRYQLPTPSRTDGGHRLFSEYDLETIKWLLARQAEGMRISQAVQYWKDLLAAGNDPLDFPAQKTPSESASPGREVSREPLSTLTRKWIDHALNYDSENAAEVLDAAFSQFPWEVVSTELVFKGLEEIGDRWYAGEVSVQQEHFASELVIQKLNALIASAPAPYHLQKVLISSPPGELHTIAPLVINTLLRYRGWDVTYLGANVPNERLEEALQMIRPALVIMTATRLRTSAALLETNQLLQDYGTPLAFGGKVFSETPGLENRLPGTYLGTDINQAVTRIEALLSTPDDFDQSTPINNLYLELRKEFQDKLPSLENKILLAFGSGIPGSYSQEVIAETTRFFLQDTLASLILGEIKYLQNNIDWVEGLIGTRGHDPKDIKHYLATFITVFEQELSQAAQPLISWMKDCLDTVA